MINKLLAALRNDTTLKSIVCVTGPKSSLKVTRRFKHRARDTRSEYAVTEGYPDYKIMQFVKRCNKKGVSAIGVIRETHYPKKKKK